MKTKIFISAILLLAIFASCSRDSATLVENRIGSGTWKVTYFFDKDHDETSDYNGLTFAFADDGVVEVSSSSTEYQGTWSTGNDDSQDKLYLTFSNPDLLIEISDDWIIDSQSVDKIELRDDSDNGTELLTFEKI